MRRLVRSWLFGLRKDKSYLVLLLLMTALGAMMPLMGLKNWIMYEEVTVFEDGFFIFLPIMAFLSSVFTSLFIGKEYDWGTIRNKVTVGHGRCGIYLSSLIVSVLGTTVLVLSYTIVYSAIGIFALEDMEIPSSRFLSLYFTSFLVLYSVNAMSVLVSHAVPSRAMALIVSASVTVVALMAGTFAVQMLMEPEMITNSMQFVDGEMVFADPYPNPRYVEPGDRWIWETMRDVLIGGQIHSIQSTEGEMLPISILSTASFAVYTLIGCIIFRKKDIK
ncbi:MAG: ABC transporter permease subunit [Candidatus Ornithospirochaeta sp.]